MNKLAQVIVAALAGALVVWFLWGVYLIGAGW